jgi:signal peptidase I
MLSVLAYITLTLTVLTTTFFMVPLVPVVNQWYQLVVVQSASMEPALKVGSLALYHPAVEYKPNDVVAYRYGDGNDTKIILHRIIEKHTNGNGEVRYVTKGDMLTQDTVSFISAEQVQGKVVTGIPLLGFVISWLQTLHGIAVALFIPLTLLLISQLTKLP